MPQLVTIGARPYAIHSEYERYNQWPKTALPNTRPVGRAAAPADVDLARLLGLRAFGGPQFERDYPQYIRHVDHVGRRTYGYNDAVILGAACWNWALTGATDWGVAEQATWVEPNDLLNMNTVPNLFGITRQAYLAGHATQGLRLCFNAHGAALTAWLDLPERNPDEQRAKMQVLVQIMCALKGLTIAQAPAPMHYFVCCQYSCRRGGPYQANFDHWGLQIAGGGLHQSLQTVPWSDRDVNFRAQPLGIWKNNHQSFVNEWTQPGHSVVLAPVANLSPAHLARIAGILVHIP
jgi:hypothetical protein